MIHSYTPLFSFSVSRNGRSWAVPVLVEGGTQDDGEVDLEDEASEAAGSLGTPRPYCKIQAAEPDEYMIMPWLSARQS